MLSLVKRAITVAMCPVDMTNLTLTVEAIFDKSTPLNKRLTKCLLQSVSHYRVLKDRPRHLQCTGSINPLLQPHLVQTMGSLHQTLPERPNLFT